MRRNTNLAEVIMEGSMPEPNTGCWIWYRSVNRQGYGKLTCLGKSLFAHRTSFATFVSTIPPHLQVCHHCDTPSCVNPSHLFLGTAAQNHADRNRKGRQARGSRQGLRVHPHRAPMGERNGAAKLTSDQVLIIRERISNGARIASIAADFSMSVAAIRFIHHRRTWRHV